MLCEARAPGVGRLERGPIVVAARHPALEPRQGVAVEVGLPLDVGDLVRVARRLLIAGPLPGRLTRDLRRRRLGEPDAKISFAMMIIASGYLWRKVIRPFVRS